MSFKYKGQDQALYERFTLAIAAGERVALVGPTGSGKSTFVKLIQRLYDLDDGQIRIDGQDVASVTQATLRRAIAVVPQDPALFHRSIAENIAYGKPDASPDEIAAAAKKARAHDFISRLSLCWSLTMAGARRRRWRLSSTPWPRAIRFGRSTRSATSARSRAGRYWRARQKT